MDLARFHCPTLPICGELRAEHPQLVDASVAAATTAAWYAMPDLVRSRPLRAVLKTGLLALVSVHSFQAMKAEDGAPCCRDGEGAPEESTSCCSDTGGCGCEEDGGTPSECGCDAECPCGEACEEDAHCECCTDGTPRSLQGLAAALGVADTRKLVIVGAGLAVAGAVLSVATEKWLFRRGERRRAEGHRLAHTRQALPLALLGAAPFLLDGVGVVKAGDAEAFDDVEITEAGPVAD